MSILQTLADAAMDEVTIGGFVWRIRKIGNAEVAELQGGALALLPVDFKRAAAEYAARKGGKDTDEPVPDIGKQVEELVMSSPANLRKMAEHQSVVVAAGTVAVRAESGGDWEPVKLVLGDRADAGKGTLRVADLPAGVESVLFGAIMRLSTDGGRAIDRLQRFRRESGDADSARPAGA